MTAEQHRTRHQLLHKMLDELITDWTSSTWIGHLESTPPLQRTVKELMEWSYQQTLAPTHEEPPSRHP